MEAIVKLQPEFFATGDEFQLRTMGLKDVRELTGLYLSVISRATSARYVLTPWRVFPLKMFFTERSVTDEEGNDISGARISNLIKQMIDTEDKAHPLSDAQIAESLAKRGLPVARRTVTKYRERLGLPVARSRR